MCGMACATSALLCPLRQTSTAQACCSADTARLTRPQLQHTTRQSAAGVRHGVRHQQHVWQAGLRPLTCAATDPDTLAEAAGGAEDEVVLTREEDWTVPGGANDSMSSNTQLGRAVQDACKELETLGGLEQETIEKANVLLQKLGYRVREQGSDKVAPD